MVKRNHAAVDYDEDFYTPLKRTSAGDWNPNDEPLQRSDGVPITTMIKRNFPSHQVPALSSLPFLIQSSVLHDGMWTFEIR